MLAHSSGRFRAAPTLRAALAVAVGIVAFGACKSDEVIDPPFADVTRPRVSLSHGKEVTDTLLSMRVNASDNLGIKTVRVFLSGGVSSQYDTTMTSAVTSLDFDLAFRVPASARLGSTVNVRAVTRDGAGNASDTARLVLTVGNLTPPQVVVTSPVSGSPVVSGKSLVVALSARARYKVAIIGYRISGAYTFSDSTSYTNPLRDTVSVLDTLVIPDSVKGKTIQITPFIVDSLLQGVTGNPVTYAVQTAAELNTIPVVSLGTARRLEVVDTIFVSATDPVGVSAVGYEVRTMSGQLVTADSVLSDGKLTTLIQTFKTRLPIGTFPSNVTITGFARNANGRREVARAGTSIRSDTVTVVNGATQALPAGGQVADALYFPRTDRLYLTNIERNQVEVFNLADSSFKTPVIVGSRPWGITPWPRSRAGVMGDTLLVANSGGTNISYVDLRTGATGREVFRYQLPNIIMYSVTTVKAAETDIPMRQRTVYDFSDRPQYLAATCAGSITAAAPCGDVVVVYSTTPTPGQSVPFPNKGTVRYENLSKRASHFFFEHAIGATKGRADTLELVRFASQGFGADSVLVPFEAGITYRIDEIAFRDTTFTRNSGNFRRAVIGEGGPVLGSRAIMYDATVGMLPGVPFPFVDGGVSRPMDVSDFIANTFARVQGVGINFDGELAAVKGDSTYVFDRMLRLQGILQSRSGVGGLDFHPANAGLNSTDLKTRLAFVASNEAVIDIFDTYCYQKISSVTIRDPIIGPIRASIRPNGQIVLVGATVRGVTMVALPNNFTTTCQ